MPLLNWASKTSPQPVPANLELDSLVYPGGAGYPDVQPENRLVLGDNLAVMSALLQDYEGRFDLIYADPPFYTNRRYPARVGRGEDSRRPQDWRLAEGYPDFWSDIDAYLDMLYPRLHLMYRLLAQEGTLYLHLDWHADHYARLLLDEIFGPERLLNEIVWVYHGPSPIRTAFNRKHDIILAYTKSERYTFNVEAVRSPYNPNTVKTFESSPKAGFGKIPDLDRGKVPEDWWYFPVVARLHNERTGYPTQKPESLLERIVLASSNPGDLVGDFFCGSGTTPLVATRLGRKVIANDGAWRAVHTTRARLVSHGAPPFMLQRLAGLQLPAGETEFLERGLGLSQGTLILDEGLLEDLDYWEVDPDWDGKVFRSAVQAVRPRKKGTIAARLALPSQHGPRQEETVHRGGVSPGGEPQACVRLVKVNGEQVTLRIVSGV
jgi:DNA modification methylase